MGTPVTLAGDWTVPSPIMPHSGLFTGAFGVVGYLAIHPHIEPPVPIYWRPGVGSHKLTSSVYHNGTTIAQDHHDCGAWIPHVCYPPDNVFIPLFMYFSKRKIYFGASTVVMQGVPAGLAAGEYPMLTCADPCSLPLTFVHTAAVNTVYLGATKGDFYAGMAGMATQMAVEALIFIVATGVEKYLLHRLLHNEFALALLEKGLIYALKYLYSHVTHSPDHASSEHASLHAPDAAATSHDASSDAAMVVPSPFGDATMTVSAAEDGAYSVTSEAPGADGSRRSARSDGLPLFPSSGGAGPGAPSFVDPLVRLVSEAPLL